MVIVFLTTFPHCASCIKIRQKHNYCFYEKFQQFFRQINVFTKEVTKELISRKFLSVIAFHIIFPHCECFIYLVYCSMRMLLPRNFLQLLSEIEFLMFPHSVCTLSLIDALVVQFFSKLIKGK